MILFVCKTKANKVKFIIDLGIRIRELFSLPIITEGNIESEPGSSVATSNTCYQEQKQPPVPLMLLCIFR